MDRLRTAPLIEQGWAECTTGFGSGDKIGGVGAGRNGRSRIPPAMVFERKTADYASLIRPTPRDRTIHAQLSATVPAGRDVVLHREPPGSATTAACRACRCAPRSHSVDHAASAR